MPQAYAQRCSQVLGSRYSNTGEAEGPVIARPIVEWTVGGVWRDRKRGVGMSVPIPVTFDMPRI